MAAGFWVRGAAGKETENVVAAAAGRLKTAAANAMVALSRTVLPSATVAGTKVTMTVAPFTISAGWDSSGPSLTANVTALKLTSGGITANVSAVEVRLNLELAYGFYRRAKHN